MAAEVVLPFPVQPDLAATMDIQIPALAWQASGSGEWRRTYRADGTAAEVTVTEVTEVPTTATATATASPIRRPPRNVRMIYLSQCRE